MIENHLKDMMLCISLGILTFLRKWKFTTIVSFFPWVLDLDRCSSQNFESDWDCETNSEEPMSTFERAPRLLKNDFRKPIRKTVAANVEFFDFGENALRSDFQMFVVQIAVFWVQNDLHRNNSERVFHCAFRSALKECFESLKLSEYSFAYTNAEPSDWRNCTDKDSQNRCRWSGARSALRWEWCPRAASTRGSPPSGRARPPKLGTWTGTVFWVRAASVCRFCSTPILRFRCLR